MADGNGAPTPPEDGKVAVTINGQTVRTEPGRLLIDVAEQMGVFIPRFCYHPGMKSVAVCRMCLVQVEGQNKLLPACATPVADEMKVNTVEENAVDAQRGMLEFLLINHPLDCPICDRAGECPLQDQTFQHGPGSSRYIEPKRTYEKALEISDLVVLDRERCVLCWRCVRFSDEIAGDRFIQLVDRGAGTQILTFNEEPFDSYFSGNTIQICPVGALTSKPYRFVSRPWDLETAPSVCTYCSVGCPITNESRSGKMVRVQALPNEQVNDFWMCDKGRFAYHHVSAEDRLETPLVRTDDDAFQSGPWGRAYATIAEKLDGKSRIGVIAGAHLTTEDAYAIGRLARQTLKTNNIDSRIQDAGAPYELALSVTGAAGSNARLDDLDEAKTIVWVGPDPKETLPVLYLRLRKAVIDHEARLVVVSPRAMSLDSIAQDRHLTAVGDEPAVLGAVETEGPVVVCWAPSSPGRDETAIAQAAIELARSTGGKLLVCPPHAGSQGMLDMGVHPALDAGYATVSEPGLDTRGILEAAAAGELDALFLFGADILNDFPNRDLAQRALEGSPFTVVVELFATETASHADVILPSAAYAEREGTFTNLERRLQKLEKLLPTPGSAKEPWDICAGIAKALGEDWSWRDFGDVWTDIKKNVKTHASVDVAALAQDMPASSLQYESPFGETAADSHHAPVAGPGGQYPKGFRQGAPFQTGQNWPLSWELRAFEAEQRPGYIPHVNGAVAEDGGASVASSAASPLSEGRLPQGGDPEGDRGLSEQAEAPTPQATADTAPGTVGNSYALITGRQLYDEGTMVSKSAALRRLQRKPFIELNDEDAKDLGIDDGQDVVVEDNGVSFTVRALIGDIVKGAVFVPYDQVGLPANQLMSGLDSSVTVRPA
jgi:NADH-quinone oxidoreductase subunit G